MQMLRSVSLGWTPVPGQGEEVPRSSLASFPLWSICLSTLEKKKKQTCVPDLQAQGQSRSPWFSFLWQQGGGGGGIRHLGESQSTARGCKAEAFQP